MAAVARPTTHASKAAGQQARPTNRPRTSRSRTCRRSTRRLAAAAGLRGAGRAAPAAPAVDPQTAQLENLANLHTQGILSDEEYAAAKAKALGV